MTLTKGSTYYLVAESFTKLLLINWRNKMKTTNNFKYAFIMIGYIALLSLSQHVKADDTQTIGAILLELK
jgi:hypothetical protein